MKYIFLSAALFVIPDFFSFLSIPCAFVFLIPLFVSFDTISSKSREIRGGKIGFIKGFVWGLLTCSIKLAWFLMMILTTGCDGLGTISGILLWIMTILYLSIFSGLWISLIMTTSRIEKRFLLTITYFGFMMLCCMAPFGLLEGYPFFSPLISLAYYPEILWCLKFICDLGALSCLICFQLFVVKRGYRFLSLVFLIPFLAGFFSCQPVKVNKSNIKYIKPWWYGCKNPAFVGHKIAESIEGELASSSTASPVIILMPESTFCFEMEDYSSFVSLWSDKDSEAIIMLGGHRRVGEIVLNSFFMLRSGKIVYVYDKMHLMPFVEREVGWSFNFSKYLFPVACTTGSSIKLLWAQSQNYQNLCTNELVNICGQIYQIFICSEFFFEVKKTKGYPVILICNESWLYFEYMKNFMVLFIKYFEIKYDVPVLYATTQGRSNF
jgi:apolipoprotein N-acyltransferase